VNGSEENYMTVGNLHENKERQVGKVHDNEREKQNWKTYQFKQHHVHSFAQGVETLFSFKVIA